MELARIIKISQGSLSDIENNKSLPSANTILSLWLHTDIDVGWLLAAENNLRDIEAGEGGSKKEPLLITLNSLESEVRIRYDINS